MSIRGFFDTNILLYAYSESGLRAQVAERLLLRGGVISVQVLNEFASTARRKFKMEWPNVRGCLRATLISCPNPQSLTVETHNLAVRISERYGFAIYDSLILASAIEAGCTVLYSEDMQHGQVIDGLRIENPFI